MGYKRKEVLNCGHICDYRCLGESGHHAWSSPCKKCPECIKKGLGEDLSSSENEKINQLRKDRNELSEEIEICHRLLDKYYGLDNDGQTSMDPLDTRLMKLLGFEHD